MSNTLLVLDFFASLHLTIIERPVDFEFFNSQLRPREVRREDGRELAQELVQDPLALLHRLARMQEHLRPDQGAVRAAHENGIPEQVQLVQVFVGDDPAAALKPEVRDDAPAALLHDHLVHGKGAALFRVRPDGPLGGQGPPASEQTGRRRVGRVPRGLRLVVGNEQGQRVACGGVGEVALHVVVGPELVEDLLVQEDPRALPLADGHGEAIERLALWDDHVSHQQALEHVQPDEEGGGNPGMGQGQVRRAGRRLGGRRFLAARHQGPLEAAHHEREGREGQDGHEVHGQSREIVEEPLGQGGVHIADQDACDGQAKGIGHDRHRRRGRQEHQLRPEPAVGQVANDQAHQDGREEEAQAAAGVDHLELHRPHLDDVAVGERRDREQVQQAHGHLGGDQPQVETEQVGDERRRRDGEEQDGEGEEQRPDRAHAQGEQHPPCQGGPHRGEDQGLKRAQLAGKEQQPRPGEGQVPGPAAASRPDQPIFDLPDEVEEQRGDQEAVAVVLGVPLPEQRGQVVLIEPGPCPQKRQCGQGEFAYC